MTLFEYNLQMRLTRESSQSRAFIYFRKWQLFRIVYDNYARKAFSFVHLYSTQTLRLTDTIDLTLEKKNAPFPAVQKLVMSSVP